MTKLTVGTRGSVLALRQTNQIVEVLMGLHPGLLIEVVVIKTKGDMILDVPLAKIDDKGLFVSELENALLSGEVDFAVHSMKDLPTEIPAGLCIAAIPERIDSCDVLITNGPGLEDLPGEARIGSSSLRRGAQLKNFRSDLRITDLRGNLDTRLRKLDEGEYGGIVLAFAGLYRMGWTDRISSRIPTEICLPAVGQGALAIEARDGDSEVIGLLKALDHQESRTAVAAERSLLQALGGGCQVPIGALGVIEQGILKLTGVIADVDGSTLVRGEVSGKPEEAESLGQELAGILLAGGGEEILKGMVDG